jgi:putative ABC transport system ATP-binding protein
VDKLVLENVSKVYGAGENAVTALDKVSLNVRTGEFVAVVGPSGSGKTTLLAITGALLLPTSGAVTLNGQSIARQSTSALAKFRLEHIGFVLQSSNLVPYLTARDQLLLVAELAGKRDRAAQQRADRLLDELGLRRRRHHYPEALSGGERQRVAIARALMNDPDVLLADEPTANLDSVRGREAVQLLAAQVKHGNKAAIMVTHDERMLDLCDRVVRIADGRISDVSVATHS